MLQHPMSNNTTCVLASSKSGSLPPCYYLGFSSHDPHATFPHSHHTSRAHYPRFHFSHAASPSTQGAFLLQPPSSREYAPEGRGFVRIS